MLGQRSVSDVTPVSVHWPVQKRRYCRFPPSVSPTWGLEGYGPYQKSILWISYHKRKPQLLLNIMASLTPYMKQVKVEVYSLVSTAKRYSPDFTQLPSGHRTCSFISHLNSPGSIHAVLQSSKALETIFIYPKAFTVLPGTHLLLGQESGLSHITKQSSYYD